MLNRYSRNPVAPPHEYQSRIPPGEPCIRQEHVPIQGYCVHKTGGICIECRILVFAPHIQHVGYIYNILVRGRSVRAVRSSARRPVCPESMCVTINERNMHYIL